MRVLVTGANGLVGSALCRALLRNGHTPVAFAREGSNTQLIPMQAIPAAGDFTLPKDVQRAMDEHTPEAIFHAGAIVSSGRPNLAESRRVNVLATRQLARFAAQFGVHRFLHVSSMSAHSGNSSIYGGTKYEAELALHEVAPAGLTIFRPSVVYGATGRGVFHRLQQVLRKMPIIPIVGNGQEPCRPVHADDLAEAFCAALAQPASVGRTYMLGGPENWTFREMLAELLRRMGLRKPVVPLPIPLCRMIAAAGEAMTDQFPLTTDNVDGLVSAQPMDISLAKADLGFQPRPFDPSMT